MIPVLLLTVGLSPGLFPFPAPLDETVLARDSSLQSYALVGIEGLTAAELDRLKRAPGLAWWVEMDTQLLVLAPSGRLESLADEFAVFRLPIPVAPRRLRFLRLDHVRDPRIFDVWELGRAGRHAVIQLRSPLPEAVWLQGHQHAVTALPFVPNSVLAARRRFSPAKAKLAADPLVTFFIDQIDEQRWRADLDFLACFNRWSHGEEIAEARDWLVQQFEDIPGLDVHTQSFPLQGTTVENVIAVLEGTVDNDQWYIVGAHYDSISENPQLAAPGGEDNASGSAAVLEMARVFAAWPPPFKMIFICYSGEEQGLFGSADHIARVVNAGEAEKIQAALIMDMIGYTFDELLDVLLETDQIAEFMVDAFADAAELYTGLTTVVSYNPFGSDHVPYLNRDVPALLTIENDWDRYPHYHRTTDFPEEVVLAQGWETLKMNIAAMSHLMGHTLRGTDPAVYLGDWRSAPAPPRTFDLNGNGLIDVAELVLVINQSQP